MTLKRLGSVVIKPHQLHIKEASKAGLFDNFDSYLKITIGQEEIKTQTLSNGGRNTRFTEYYSMRVTGEE